MKRRCLISRLDEPNIAHLYVIEADQNLLNNIRVLCTKHPETLRFFVPQELFLDIRNGEYVAMTVECYDEFGRKRFTVDPLKVLSEQIREQEFFEDEGEELDFRLRIEGYKLPRPEEGPADFLTRPAMYRQTRQGAGSGSYRSAGRGRTGGGYRSDSGFGGARGRKTGSGYGRTGGGSDEPVVDPSFRRRKHFPWRSIVLTLALVSMVAGFFLIRDTSVKRFGEKMETGRYKEAVFIYNNEIYGHPSREERVDPQAKLVIESIRDGYIADQYSYENACDHLTSLSGFEKRELAELAGESLEEVERYRAASMTLQKGITFMEQQNYMQAIEEFLQIQESSPVYDEAQDDLDRCVTLLTRSALKAQSEQEWLDSIELIDSATALLPTSEELAQCREECESKYQDLVRQNAIADAQELAAQKDYAGAFARIDRGLEILQQDEELTEKAAALREQFTQETIREAASLVDEGAFDEAGEVVETAMETYSCSELENLAEQIGAGWDDVNTDVEKYTAPKITFAEYKGALSKTALKAEHAVAAAQDGASSFFLTGMDSKLKVQLTVKGPTGAEVVKAAALVNGSEVSCTLEKGKTYTVQVALVEGEGSYVLRFGQQKAAADITPYDLVSDSTEFKNQCNTYYYVPSLSGGFRFDMASGAKGAALKVGIYDRLGGELFYGDMTDGGGVTVEMAAAEKYTIKATQIGETGEYELAIGKPSSSVDITGKYITPDAFTFAGQKKSYTFRVAQSGQYKITLGNLPENAFAEVFVYSQLGEKIAGTSSLGSGKSVVCELREGQGYQIRMTQQSGIGEYTLTIVKE